MFYGEGDFKNYFGATHTGIQDTDCHGAPQNKYNTAMRWCADLYVQGQSKRSRYTGHVAISNKIAGKKDSGKQYDAQDADSNSDTSSRSLVR